MDWFQPIDNYCERIDVSFWSEPMNAVSNAAFLIAALAAAHRATRPGASTDWPVLSFAIVVFLIGIGSFLFHTFANRWSAQMDALPIQAFMFGYFFLAMRRFFALHALWGAILTALFFGTSIMVIDTVPRDFLNGGVEYVVGLMAILVVGVILAAQNKPSASLILLAGVTFIVSFTFRSVDMIVCDALPIGTHYFWHLLNALTLWLLLAAALKHRRERGRTGLRRAMAR